MAEVKVWTEDMEKFIAELWPHSSASQIAVAVNKKFGRNFTRHAVMGKLNRLDLLGTKGNVRIDEKYIVHLFKMGLAVSDITEVMNCSSFAVYMYLARNGLKAGNRTRIAEVVEDLSSGLTVEEVAEKREIKPITVRNYWYQRTTWT